MYVINVLYSINELLLIILHYFHMILDSEKSTTVGGEGGSHFNIPRCPYPWSAYSGSDLRHLVRGPYHRHVQSHRQRHPPVSLFGAEESAKETLYAQKVPVTASYEDYSSVAHQICRMRDRDELYLEMKQGPRGAEIKSESDFICSNLDSNGSYKCIKCGKVRILPTTEPSC